MIIIFSIKKKKRKWGPYEANASMTIFLDELIMRSFSLQGKQI